MNVSFWKDLLHNPHNDKEYGEPSKLQIAELTDILKICKDIPVEAKKGDVKASIFPFIGDSFYRKEQIEEENIKTDGALLDDIDHINDGREQIIYDSFDELCKLIPNLYVMWFSQSRNLHVAFHTEALNADEYRKQELLSLIYLSQAIEIVTKIKLDDGEGGNIDDHNKSISQRFRLNRIEEFKYNENFIIGNFPELKDEELEKAKEKWPRICDMIDNVPKIIKHIKKINDNDEIKTKAVGKHSYIVHKTRWRLYDTLVYIYKDKDKTDEAWLRCCSIMDLGDHHTLSEFEKEPNKNDWYDRYTGEYVDLELAEEFGIFVEKKAPMHLEEGEYITKYEDEILNFIKENDRVCFKSGTGVGKTTLVNGDEYGFVRNLSKLYNAIVIVPYNTTNNLYSSSIEIGTQSKNYSVKDNESCVMVWDQAIIHWEDIKDRNFIIDECHRLFLDVDWRGTSIKLMDLIKTKENGKVIMFSATPSGEVEELGCKVMNITNWHRTVNLRFIETSHVDRHQLGYIKRCYLSNYYDRIVLFDDTTMKKIYENLICDEANSYDILYARSETKDRKEVRELINNEILAHKLTLCTRSFFEGLNFNNRNERILVVSSFRQGKTTSNNLIQQIGRIRNSDVTAIVMYDDKDYSNEITDENIDNAKKQSKYANEEGIKTDYLAYDSRLLDPHWVEINRRMIEWTKKHSELETVIDEMNECGYFKIKTILNDDLGESQGDRLALKYKKRMSDEFKQEILKGDWDSNIYLYESYKHEWQSRLKKLMNDDTIRGLDIQQVKDIIENGKAVSIETIINRLDIMTKVACETEEYWNKYNTKVKELMKEIDKVHAKRLSAKVKTLNKIRKEVKGKFKRVEGNIVDVSDLFTWLVEEAKKEQDERVQKNSKAARKKIKDIETGITYDSVSDCANDIGHNITYISKHKDRFIQI